MSIQAATNDPEIIVICPPDGEISGEDASTIDAHIREAISGVVVKLIDALAIKVTACEEALAKGVGNTPNFNSSSFTTPYEELEAAALAQYGTCIHRFLNTSIAFLLPKGITDIALSVDQGTAFPCPYFIFVYRLAYYRLAVSAVPNIF
jgi:hypothetical protein